MRSANQLRCRRAEACAKVQVCILHCALSASVHCASMHCVQVCIAISTNRIISSTDIINTISSFISFTIISTFICTTIICSISVVITNNAAINEANLDFLHHHDHYLNKTLPIYIDKALPSVLIMQIYLLFWQMN